MSPLLSLSYTPSFFPSIAHITSLTLSSAFPFPLISQWLSPQLASLKVFPPAN